MRIAQRLYENGYITYMRTDSVTLSSAAIGAARSSAQSLYGKESVPDSPRIYEGKTKNAQEAHEAIRPAGDSFRTPGELAPELSRDEFALYDLIWKRTIASQMADAKKQQMRVDFDVKTKSGDDAIFRANGSVIVFPGFLSAYEDIVEEKADTEEVDRRLPAMSVGEKIAVNEYNCEGHETKPPARYTEPTLVKKLEELGIGRPSTFASIMQTIQDRGYVAKRGRALVPTFLAFSVTGLLEQHFTKLIDYEFTASMEEDLDKIANGEEERVAWLTKFFYGSENNPGLADLSADLGAIDAQAINTMKMGEDIEIRVGRFGAYLQQGSGEERKYANIPEEMAPDELTLSKAIELLAKPSGERKLGVDPATGLELIAKSGRFGAYVTEVFPEEIVEEGAKKKRKKKDAPKPRTLEIYRQPKVRRRGVAKPPLKELGKDPQTSRDVIVKDGRFGVYVTDGETNATLRRGDAVELLTLERALELLAGRRAWEIENPEGSKKKGKRSKKSAPTLTEKTVKGSAAKKKAKKGATGVGNLPE